MSNEIAVGAWALIMGYNDGLLRPDVCQIEKTSEKLVYHRWAPTASRLNQSPKTDVIATFADKQSAERLRDTLAGIRGERDDRINRAREAASVSAHKAIAKAVGSKDNG